MSGMKPPLHYSYQSKEEIIQVLALREYYTAIDIFSEIMSYHEKTKNYPKNLVIQFMAHVINLSLQMAAFKPDLVNEIVELKNKKNQMTTFSDTYLIFQKIQRLMKQKGFLRVSGSYRMNNQDKGEGIALGYA